MIGDRFSEVLAAAQDGDEAAFATLWRDNNPGLLRYLTALSPSTAEDVAAETWVQVVRGLRGFRGDEGAWRGWLFTVARRRLLDDARRRSRRPTVPLATASDAARRSSPDAADLALDKLGTDAALALIATLPRLQAEAILLRVIAGLDYEEVARVLGRSPGAVRVAAHRGLRRLAETLQPTGVTE